MDPTDVRFTQVNDNDLKDQLDCLQRTDGISQALLTTMFGLIVAIPVTASFAFIRNRMVKTVIEVGAILEDLFERFREGQG